MIRHANSLLLSLILHAILLFALFYGAKTLYYYAEKKENVIPIKLCNIACQSQKNACECDVPLKKVQKIQEQNKTENKQVEKVKKVQRVQQVKEIKKSVEVTQKIKPIKTPPIEEKTPIITDETPVIATKQELREQSPMQESQEARQQRLESEYLDEHMQAIIKLLQENLYYPKRARENGITGERVVRFILDKDGVVVFCEVISPENDILSRAAIKTLENLSGDFPKPKEKLAIRLPINYNLIK